MAKKGYTPEQIINKRSFITLTANKQGYSIGIIVEMGNPN